MHGAQQISNYPLASEPLAGRLCNRLDDVDLRDVECLLSAPHSLPDGKMLVVRGEELRHATLLVEGFLFCSIMRDGRRFIVGVHVPGEFVDLHGFILKRLDHDIVSVGPARVAHVDHGS